MPPHMTSTALELGIRFSRPILLLFITMLWSLPLFVYPILFFRELRKLAPGSGLVHPSKEGESSNAGSVLRIEYLLPTAAAATTAFMFGLFIDASWTMCLMLIAAVAVWIGGVAFTLVEMHRLALLQNRAAQYDSSDPNRFAEATLRAQSHIAVMQSRREFDPCPHHEYYPESAGEDQGQLTSHLSGSTPFIDHLEVSIARTIKCLREGIHFRKSKLGSLVERKL